ncbi:hypothetical protein [Kordia jejudonensis]|uniref:hypothetical protein n=1 Tax=Kordia jejudonensis TaxID=1348245 RepID=UPI0006298AF3|nr:hypothetical protein [Kordia jejudonensis]
MKKLLIVLLVLLTSCSTSLETDISSDRDFSKLLGKRITVEGTAANTKFGALVITNDNASIWIDKLESWPAQYNAEGDNGKTVIVTGVIIEKFDLPVVVNKNGQSSKTSSRKYVLTEAIWGLLPD